MGQGDSSDKCDECGRESDVWYCEGKRLCFGCKAKCTPACRSICDEISQREAEEIMKYNTFLFGLEDALQCASEQLTESDMLARVSELIEDNDCFVDDLEDRTHSLLLVSAELDCVSLSGDELVKKIRSRENLALYLGAALGAIGSIAFHLLVQLL